MAYVAPGDAEPGTIARYRDPRCAARRRQRGRRPLPFYQEGCAERDGARPICATPRTTSGSASKATRPPIGITDYAADQLGDIVFVELPDAGRALEQFAAFGVVESVKAVSDLFAPVSGEVSRGERRARRQPRAGQQRPVRRRLDDPGRLDRPGPARRPARRRPPTTRSSRPADPPDAVRSPHRRRSRADARGARPRHRSTSSSRTSRPSSAPRRSTCPSPSPSSSWPPGSARWPRATGPTSPRSSGPASTGTGARPRSTSSCCAGSGTRPTRRTSPRSARAPSRASTSTSRCWPSWSTSTSCPPRTTTGRRPRPRPR